MRKILLLSLLIATHLHATVKFVQPSGTGAGTSWAAAWTNPGNIVWSSLNAGDTVCIAGGSYTSSAITSGKSGTSGSPITIKRATASDATCGSSTSGWNSAFDAHVSVSGIVLSNSFVTIDGAVTNGLTTVLALTDCTGGNQCSNIHFTGPTNGVVLRNVEAAGPCPNGSTGCTTSGDSDPRGIDMNGPCCYAAQTNFLFHNVNVHGACNLVYMAGADTGIIENSRFADAVNNGFGCHENVIIGGQNGSTVTFRWNEVTNWNNEGFLFCPGPGTCPNNNWDIYGNVWHDPNNVAFPRAFAMQNSNTGTWHVYNNSFIHFVDQSGPGFACYSGEGGDPNAGAAFNNLYIGNTSFFSCGFPAALAEDYAAADGTTGQTHGQNTLTTASLVNYAAHTVAGYNLSGHTTSGNALGAPFNVDYNGNTRTTWDRGAFEFASGGSSTPSSTTGTWSNGAKFQ